MVRMPSDTTGLSLCRTTNIMDEEDGDGAAAGAKQSKRDLRAARSDEAVLTFAEILCARGFAIEAIVGGNRDTLAALAARRGWVGWYDEPLPDHIAAQPLPALSLPALCTARVTDKTALPVIRAVLPDDAPHDAFAVMAGVPRGARYLVFIARGEALHMDAARTILAACDAAGAAHAAVLTEFDLTHGTRTELRTKGVSCENFLIARLVRNPLRHALMPRYTALAASDPAVLDARRHAGPARQLPQLPFEDMAVRLLGLPAGAHVLEEPRAGMRLPLSACVRQVTYSYGDTTPFMDLRPTVPLPKEGGDAPPQGAPALLGGATVLQRFKLGTIRGLGTRALRQ